MTRSFHCYVYESNSSSNCWEVEQAEGQNFEFRWHLCTFDFKTRKSSLRTVLNPQLWPWGERLQHEKQTDLFRNLKFHDWLVTASLPYIMPWSCVFLVVSFVWWSAVTNQSWNFKLRNKSVCFSCYFWLQEQSTKEQFVSLTRRLTTQ